MRRSVKRSQAPAIESARGRNVGDLRAFVDGHERVMTVAGPRGAVPVTSPRLRASSPRPRTGRLRIRLVAARERGFTSTAVPDLRFTGYDCSRATASTPAMASPVRL